MSTPQELAPKQTPAPLRHASADNETGILQDMSSTAFKCEQWLENVTGKVLAGPLPVTRTVPVDVNGVVVNHFLIEMPLDMADLLTAVGDEVATYRWYSVITNTADPRRDPVSEILQIARAYGDIQATVSVSSSDVAGPALNDGIFTASNPEDLPERAPTDDELEALALIGVYWSDQLLAPGRPEATISELPYMWVRQQPDHVRNAINALIKRTIETSNDVAESQAASAPDLLSMCIS